MKCISVKLDKSLKSLEIVPLADLHIGDRQCDMKLIQEKIDYIASGTSIYCLLNGDIINNSTKTSIGDVYSERLTPMEQLENAKELLEPIKDKILCITNGNHEMRTWRNDGIDLMKILAKELGIEDRYSNTSAMLFLRLGDNGEKARFRQVCYTIFVNHGSGGGKKEGAKAIRLADMASIVDADIYIHSHTHLPMIMKESFFRTDTRTSTVSAVDKLFVNTSSFLTYGGYGEQHEFKPNSTDTPHIYLGGTRKNIKAKL